MTQQPYYPQPDPQQPQYAPAPQQQPYPQPVQQPQYPVYAPPVQQPYPPQPMGQQYPAPAQAGGFQGQQVPPPVTGTLDDFFNQPSSGGGPSLKFEQVGQRYVGTVAREIGPGDVQQQTDTQGRPQTFKDGRAKWVMKVPLQVPADQTYPDGVAQWYVKGGARDELARAMAESGSSARAPEAGATIDVTFTSTRNSGAGMNPAKVFRVVYTPPDQAPSQQGHAPAQPIAQPEQPVQQQQYAPAPEQVQYQQPVQQPVQQPQYQQAPQGQPAPLQAQAPQAQPQQMATPAGMTPEQAALMAQLGVGQQQGQPA